MFTSNDEVLAYIKKNGIQFVDVRFCDLPGQMQHVTIPAENFNEGTLSGGVAFDGSSIRGFQQIHESDMVLLPDVGTAFVDPFRAHPTLVLNWFVHDPVTREPYSRDPRNVARKAEAHLKGSGFGDTAYFGQEAEFYIFDDVRFDVTPNSAFHVIDSVEGAWNSGREEEGGNLGYKPKYKGGYYPVPPTDHFADLRNEMARVLLDSGIHIELHHHEVGTAGQAEIGVQFGTLLAQADKLLKFKYIVKSVARRAGRTVTFMPKPIFGDNGSGMHVHQSVWKGGENLFFQDGTYADLSDTARHYIGGLLYHAPRLLAFTNPTMNSYHRLVPGFEAPTNLVYSQRNRSACIRIPITGKNPKAKRIEFRVPDPSCNPYFAYAAMLMAGLDGIRRKLEPAGPYDQDLYELDAHELEAIPQVPGSLEKVLDNLEEDHAFLTEGGVFTEDLIETWIAFKRENEIDPLRFRPHPYEFALSFDV